LKDLAKIVGYLAAVIVLAALLAPPLYWAGKALATHGIAPILGQFGFQKYFNRAALIAAVALLWPLVRALRIRGWRDLGIEGDPHRLRHALGGFAIAAAAVAAMGAGYVAFGFYKWRAPLPWEKIPPLAASALVVAIIEEMLFRGAIFGLLRRTMRPLAALFSVTALFAILHFLKPDPSFAVRHVTWLSGFEMVPHAFHQFAEPATLLAGFGTLFALGWLLGDATLRTRSLWMSVGLHAGVVFVKMSFSALAKRKAVLLPWIGPEIQIGLVPVAALLLAWGAVRLWLAYENHHCNPRRG
jgi:membrane protease YdiL (CAAX protease family)